MFNYCIDKHNMSDKVVINFRNYGVRFAILLILIFIVFKVYQWFTKCTDCEQRVYPGIRMNKSRDFKLSLIAVSDKIIPSKDVFKYNFPLSFGFKTIFKTEEERNKAKEESRKFFQNTFGLSDLHLKLFMWELRVNDSLDYRFVHDNSTLLDGGYICYVPPKTVLRGTYGGVNGVIVNKGGVLAFGYYVGGGYKIRYWSMCPLVTHKTYDGNYTPIDCDLEIEDALDKKLIGTKGKAQGIYKIINYKGLTNHVTIRNVMTFF